MYLLFLTSQIWEFDALSHMIVFINRNNSWLQPYKKMSIKWGHFLYDLQHDDSFRSTSFYHNPVS